MRRPHEGPKPAWYYGHRNRISVRVQWMRRNADHAAGMSKTVAFMRRVNRRRGRRLPGWRW